MKTFVDQYGQRDDGKIGIVEVIELCSITTKSRERETRFQAPYNNFLNLLQLAHVLPTEENFLLLFRCQQLKSCEEFMKTWRRYDTDHSGFIETEELKNFLKDLLEKANKTVDDTKLAEYTDLMGVKMCGKEFNKAFELYDQDGNGYIDENELDALLKDLCEKNKQDLDINNIPTYKKSIMALSDGGKLYRTDLALILSAGDN
ncbi:calbindin [Camelus ferus]|nr:calbindin [Camelus ferus]